MKNKLKNFSKNVFVLINPFLIKKLSKNKKKVKQYRELHNLVENWLKFKIKQHMFIKKVVQAFCCILT